MTELANALRLKFGTPAKALKALGLDESLLRQKEHEMRPTRFEALAIRTTARAVNPLLAFDAQVDYAPIFKGLTSKNFKERRPAILTGLKTALAGKTLAGDAALNLTHVGKTLDRIKAMPTALALDAACTEKEAKDAEMESKGKNKEDDKAEDKKAFDAEPTRAMLKEKGMSEDDIESVMDCMMESMPEEFRKEKDKAEDEEPENALDEDDDEDETAEEKAARMRKEAKDKKAKDKARDEKEDDDKAAKAKDAKDKKAMDERLKGMITMDEAKAIAEGAVAAERSRNAALHEAREFVRPIVGDLPMALDSAVKVLRAAATARGVSNVDKINEAGLRTILEMQAPAGAHSGGYDRSNFAMDSAEDGDGDSGFASRWPEASRIGHA
jgi:hypothetical protein